MNAPSDNAMSMTGTPPALMRELGIDVSGLGLEGEGVTAEALGRDGHVWHLEGHWPLISAFRERTDEELELYIDECNSRSYSGFFSTDRQMLCREVANHFMVLASQIRPERPMPRSRRRELRRRLDLLGDIQFSLLKWRQVDMKEARERLRSLGLPSEQYRRN